MIYGTGQEILKNQSEDETKKLVEMQSKKEELKLEIDKLISNIENMQNLGYEHNQKQEKLNSEINLANQRKENNKENYERLIKEIQELSEKINNLEEDKKQKQDKKINLNKNKEQFEQELEEKEAKLQELTGKLSEKEIEIEQKKAKIQENVDKKYEENSNISLGKANYENLEKRERILKNELSNIISELDETRLTKSEVENNYINAENKKNEIAKKLENIIETKEKSTEKIKNYEENKNKLETELRFKESRLRFLIETEKEKEGYNKTIKSLLIDCERNKELANGMHGVLANLINVDKEYEIAIEMCLGASLQNIVTETEDDAKRLVDHLRKNNLGRASFLPISSVRGKKVDRLIKNNLSGVIGIASDLIKTDKKYEQIILNLLGKTVIVDNMDTGIILARQNSYSFRIVTLKGDIINASGAITGGSVQTKTVNILGRTREIEELEEETKKLKNRIDEILREKEEYINSIENILRMSETLENEAKQNDIIYATEKQKLISIEESVNKLQNNLKNHREELENINNEKQRIETEKQEHIKNINELEKETEKLEIEVQKFVELHKNEQKYIDDLNFEITNLKISVTSFEESNLSIDEVIEMIDKDIRTNKQSVLMKEEQKQKLQEDNKLIDENVLKLKEEIEEMKLKIQNSGNEIEKLKEVRLNKNEELTKTEKDIEEEQENINNIKDQISKIDLKKSKVELELEQIINKMWEEYELTPNNVTNYEKADNPQNTTKQVNNLKSQIKELGSVNVDAIEEYKITKERYDFLSEQRLDLENSSTKLKKVIQDMTQIMKTQFKEQFEIINKNFGEVFKELFGGGKANLILNDEEDILNCGIDIEAQPPGKKLQNMMLLSGGEKALTAIAILFAILKINPAPFCVLDEIEAALDDINVYRFADYLKKFANKTQFLVITHRKGTMQAADTVYGVTMEENGISKLLSMKLK